MPGNRPFTDLFYRSQYCWAFHRIYSHPIGPTLKLAVPMSCVPNPCPMKKGSTYLMITMVTGLFALGTMVSAGLPHACEYADSNLLYIRDKIKEALVAGDLNMTRYHTYKALNGIAKNRANLLDCGCKASLERMDHAHAELKEAARSGTLGESIPLLKKALENTSLGRAHLREFAWEKASPYGMALLYMNTREVPAGKNCLLEIPG